MQHSQEVHHARDMRARLQHCSANCHSGCSVSVGGGSTPDERWLAHVPAMHHSMPHPMHVFGKILQAQPYVSVCETVEAVEIVIKTIEKLLTAAVKKLFATVTSHRRTPINQSNASLLQACFRCTHEYKSTTGTAPLTPVKALLRYCATAPSALVWSGMACCALDSSEPLALACLPQQQEGSRHVSGSGDSETGAQSYRRQARWQAVQAGRQLKGGQRGSKQWASC